MQCGMSEWMSLSKLPVWDNNDYHYNHVYNCTTNNEPTSNNKTAEDNSGSFEFFCSNTEHL